MKRYDGWARLAQVLCIVWAFGAVISCFYSFLLGIPLSVRLLGVDAVFAAFAITQVPPMLARMSVAYGIVAAYALCWGIHLLTAPRDFLLPPTQTVKYAAAAWQGISIAAAIKCVLSVSEPEAQTPDAIRFTRRTAVIAGACACVVASGLYASSFFCRTAHAVKLASRHDLIGGDWWGIRSNSFVHPDDNYMEVQRLTFLGDGQGQFALWNAINDHSPGGMLWIIRGHRLQISLMSTDVWTHHASCIGISADKKSITFLDDPFVGATTYYREDTIEGKRLKQLAIANQDERAPVESTHPSTSTRVPSRF